LVEHNYYRLMEIESYSDVETVKKRYRELAKLYHPDRNPNNKHAEEYFKILTQGYNILSEPDDKILYDNALKGYYTVKPNEVPKPSREEVTREKVKAYKENKRKLFVEEFLKAEDEFPHKYRFLISIMLFFSGILMCYNHWFINLLNYKILYIVLGGFLFGFGAYQSAENIYKRRTFKKAMRIEPYNSDGGSIRIFLFLFFVTPILFLGLMKVTKKVHLTYFYETCDVDRVKFFANELEYYYIVNDELIARRTDKIPIEAYYDMDKVKVRFSRINPVISELVAVP